MGQDCRELLGGLEMQRRRHFQEGPFGTREEMCILARTQLLQLEDLRVPEATG